MPMGKSAAKMLQWMGNPARFADFYNGNVFGGNKVIHPEELVPAKGEIHKIEKDKDKSQKEIHRYRDIIMYWKKYGINLAILAIENQKNVHLAMPVRNMMYDSIAYQEQIDFHWNLLSQEEKNKCSKKEYLSHYLIGEKLNPIITLVFYYGDDEWLENTELYNMLEMEELEKMHPEVKQYIQNYKLNLIDMMHMKDINVFHSDLQYVFGMLKYKGNKELLSSYVNENPEYFNYIDKETALVIGELLDSEDILKTADEIREGERMSMCKALEDLYNEGRLEGRLDALTVQIRKKLAKGKSIAEIADALEETTEAIESIIKKQGLL